MPLILLQTLADVTSFVKEFGFPIALILGFLWFLTFKVWPWITVRWEKREENSRQEREKMISLIETQLLTTQSRQDTILTPMVKSLDSIQRALEATASKLEDLTEEIRSHK